MKFQSSKEPVTVSNVTVVSENTVTDFTQGEPFHSAVTQTHTGPVSMNRKYLSVWLSVYEQTATAL
jgi:hypothetical protein